MNTLYIVEYKDLSYSGSGMNYRYSKILGRFSDDQTALNFLGHRFPSSLYEVLKVRPANKFEATCHKAKRFIIRTLRIIFSSLIALPLFTWLVGRISSLGNIPFSEFTLNIFASTVFYLVTFVVSLCLCWFIAFGAAPENRSDHVHQERGR